MKHTRSPWDYLPAQPDGTCAALVAKSSFVAEFIDGPSEENARLIVSAPELLEVLQVLAEHDFGANGWTPLLESAAIKARAAIRKATGE